MTAVESAVPARLRLEQLISTTAARTLGLPGSEAPVVRSADWPRSLSRHSPGLGMLLRPFFVEGQAAQVAATRSPEGPDQLGFLIVAEGHLAFCKTYLGTDPFGRPGRFVVHLLLDPSRRLRARDLLELWRGGRFVTAWPWQREPVDDARALTVRAAAPTPAALDDGTQVRIAAALLQGLDTGVPVVLRGTGLGMRLASVVSVVDGLGALAARRSLCTRGAVAPGLVADLTLVDPNLPARPVESPGLLDLDFGAPEPDAVEAAYAALAARWIEVRAAGEVLPPEVATLPDLDAWLMRRERWAVPPAELSDSDVLALLGSPDGVAWAARPLARARVRDLVRTHPELVADRRVRAVDDEHLRTEALARLRHGLLDARLRGVPARADYRTAYESLGQVIADLDEDFVAQACAVPGPANLSDAALADLLALVLSGRYPPTPAMVARWIDDERVRRAVAAAPWSPFAPAAIAYWLVRPTEPPPAVVQREPERTAEVVLAWLSDQGALGAELLHRALPYGSAVRRLIADRLVTDRSLPLDLRTALGEPRDQAWRARVRAVVLAETGIDAGLLRWLGEESAVPRPAPRASPTTAVHPAAPPALETPPARAGRSEVVVSVALLAGLAVGYVLAAVGGSVLAVMAVVTVLGITVAIARRIWWPSATAQSRQRGAGLIRIPARLAARRARGARR